MYYEDHNPPHFHVYYSEFEAQIDLQTLEIIKGRLPNRVLSLTLEWAILHRNELKDNWQLAAKHKALNKIEPLE